MVVSLAVTLQTPAGVSGTLEKEIARVQRELEQTTSQDERAGAEMRLARAAEATRKGRVYLALYELSPAWRMQAASTFAAGLRDKVHTAEGFRKEWSAVGEPHLPLPPVSLPLAIGAIATSSEAVAPATYRASLPYAEDAGVSSGVYYLGDSQGALQFGAFCRTLNLGARGPRPSLRSVAPEIDRFEADVLKNYNKADAAARRPFIQISVGLKIARERDASGDYAAALLQYLLARYQHALLGSTLPAADIDGRIKSSESGMRNADHSIGELFLQLASAQLESADPQGARNATAIIDVVIPEYLGIVKQ